ncbi:MauE/DoxX family redox-associated membrane protein [Janibacter anophelis]|uniref:MauE/DoxX family redox-associated membrane protein n=1 Tax=Janibacter anophelis TaxID=319054 RepID=UPI000DEF0EB1|nr:MauE/DoxX family redox-associated membrane protein [Janibacter anophelis]
MTPVALLTCALVLGATGLGHAAAPGRTRQEIAAHRVLPRPLAYVVALALPPLELGIAALLVGAVLTPQVALDRWSGGAAALLLTAFAGYLALALRRGAGGLPCACGAGTAPLAGWSVARAALLAGCALLGALLPSSLAITSRPWAEVVIVGCAAVTFAIGLWALPSARHDLGARPREAHP